MDKETIGLLCGLGGLGVLGLAFLSIWLYLHLVKRRYEARKKAAEADDPKDKSKEDQSKGEENQSNNEFDPLGTFREEDEQEGEGANPEEVKIRIEENSGNSRPSQSSEGNPMAAVFSLGNSKT